MDDTRFDRLTRALIAAPTRRRVLGGLAALALPGLADAKKKRKKKRKKHKKDNEDICPQSRSCGEDVCCPPGEICAGAACVIGQGACATGSDTCESGTLILCTENCLCVTATEGDTRCAQPFGAPCGSCTSSADCAKYGALAFCAAAGPGCGCQKGEGVCLFACFG